MKKADLFWQTYLNLENDFKDLSKYIFITDVKTVVNQSGNSFEQPYEFQLETFSPYISDLLVQCCVQIESVSKELYFDIGGTKQRGDASLLFDEDCLKEIDKKWKAHEKTVLVVAPFFNLTKDTNKILHPLKEAHKRSGTYWEKAYQAVKHDRYTFLNKGNVRALLHAMAALFLLNIYYRNEKWFVKYRDIGKIDMSFGSSIFAIKHPTTNQLWYGNQPVHNDSPYIVQYKDEDYQEIKEIQDKEQEAINQYWRTQPELLEPAFQQQLLNEKAKNERVMEIWELGKYRINKEIDQNLSFEERKELLLNSEAWNCWTHQHNRPRNADEITERNIQDEINCAGLHWGMETMNKIQPMAWLNLALNKATCKVELG